uniref:Reverse transcriptase zinc-binding domain-containing protein n=1 Tax=Lactuca sativa TaxID=4236 RepID=A0A9R1WU04_LACSA|nr:hypothetical protein LSAT_V11C100039910 [Lactuca sativa]
MLTQEVLLSKIIGDVVLRKEGSIHTNLPTIWSNVVPGKINIFIWRVRLGKLSTRLNLAQRGVNIPNTFCPLCNAFEENEVHIFKKCSKTLEIHGHIHTWWNDFPTSTDSLEDLLGKRYCKSGKNDVIFNTNTKVKSSLALAYDVKALAFLWIRNRAKWGRNLIWNFWVENPLYCTT